MTFTFFVIDSFLNRWLNILYRHKFSTIVRQTLVQKNTLQI